MHNEEFPFCNDCTADPRLLGLGSLLSPMIKHAAAQRVVMWHNHTAQFQVLNKPEAPELSPGFDLLVSDYIVQPSARQEDGQILSVILKYIPGRWATAVTQSPRATVIYLGNDSHTVDYFHLDAFTKGTDGYGFPNKIMNQRYLSPGNYLPKEIQLQATPTQLDTHQVGMGINVNVAAMVLGDVAEDAFVVSDELMDKMTPMSYRTVSVEINPDQLPLDIYGDGTEYKFMPDIGEAIRPDGMIIGLRKPDAVSMVSDVTEEALRNPQILHDEIYYAAGANARIVDIDIYIGNKQKLHPVIFGQLFKYRESLVEYHTNIVLAYNEAKTKGWKISNRFNTLVYTSMVMLASENRPIPGLFKAPPVRLMKKKEPIRHILLNITYAHKTVLSSGAKFTDRYGGKGVSMGVIPKSEMPIDEYGIQADMVVDIISMANRMNPGWDYERFLSRTNWFMRKRLHAMLMNQDIRQPITIVGAHGKPIDIPPVGEEVRAVTPWGIVMEYLTDIYPKFANAVEKSHSDTSSQMQLLQQIIEEGFQIVSPPFNKYIGVEWLIKMDQKWPAPKTPITYCIRKRGGEFKWTTTKKAVSIGAKYMFLLYAMPKCKASGPGYTSQHKTPIHPSPKARLQSPGVKTPLRLGEDEVRMLIAIAGQEVAARILGLYANSDTGLKMMLDTLLTHPHPTNIDSIGISTKELVKTNNIVNLTQHMLATVGVDISTRLKPGDPRYNIMDNLPSSKDIDLSAILEENQEADFDELKEGILADLMSVMDGDEDYPHTHRQSATCMRALDESDLPSTSTEEECFKCLDEFDLDSEIEIQVGDDGQLITTEED